MWLLIFAAMGLVTIVSGVYLTTRVGRIEFVKKCARDKRPLKIIFPLIPIIVTIVVLYLCLGGINTLVCMIHILFIWIIVDLINFAVEKKRKKKTPYHIVSIVAVFVCITYLGGAWYRAHHVQPTYYDITTEKEVGSLRIVQMADSHMGALFSGKEFEKYVDEIQEQSPDVVVITGDFADDSTSRQDMMDACRALGKLKTKYGVYFVYGNHDKGYYPAELRGYTAEELAAELQKNSVIILEDENVLIDDRYYLIGRQDRSEEQLGGERASMEELTQGIDKDKFSIVLDHQPHDYEAQRKAGVDLVLSGHTHGGQFIPINYIGEWMGENDKTYGLGDRDGTNFIVTSGIADWEIKFKTGCKAEYVVIDINA